MWWVEAATERMVATFFGGQIAQYVEGRQAGGISETKPPFLLHFNLEQLFHLFDFGTNDELAIGLP